MKSLSIFLVSATCLFFLSWCSHSSLNIDQNISDISNNVTNTINKAPGLSDSISQAKDIASETINTFKNNAKDFKENAIIMIEWAEITSLPIIKDIQDLVVQGLTSLKQATPSENETIKCLQDKGVTYYTSRTCAFAFQQSDVLGDDINSFDRIRCDESKDLVACANRWVLGTPAFGSSDWKLIHWVQSVTTLAQAFGCK